MEAFKSFKFASSKPPPLPPKDPIYLLSTAESRLSLLTTMTPDSPISPSIQYAIRRANSPSLNSAFLQDNYSSSDLPSSSSSPNIQAYRPPPQNSIASTSSGPRIPTNSKKDKALAFLKFPKRGPRSPLPQPSPYNDEMDPPPPQQDDGISMPWNFQHNIHVDEGYGGLPPSWSTSLAASGFTEDEILAIQARRGVSGGLRSPLDNMRYLYNDRPRTPADGAFQQSVLENPLPRTTSLPRRAPPPPSSTSSDNDHQSSKSRPVLAPLTTSITSSASDPSPGQTSTPRATSVRKPPPSRRPPTPTEEVVKGHAPEPSASSISQGSSIHTLNDSFSGTNNSLAYNYNPPSQKMVSSANDDDDEDMPLAMVPNRLKAGEILKEKPSLWDSKKPSNSSSNLNSSTDLSSSTSTWKSTTAAASSSFANVAAKGSSLAEGMVKQMKNSAAKIRSGRKESDDLTANASTSLAGKKKVKKARGLAAMFQDDSDGDDDGDMGVETEDDSDEEFVSLPHDFLESEPNVGGKPAVWQIYTRPRASANGADGNASLTSLGSGSVDSRRISRSHSQSQPQISSKVKFIRTTASENSLRSQLKFNKSNGSLRSNGYAHNPSSSLTSLESIPEGEAPVLQPRPSLEADLNGNLKMIALQPVRPANAQNTLVDQVSETRTEKEGSSAGNLIRRLGIGGSGKISKSSEAVDSSYASSTSSSAQMASSPPPVISPLKKAPNLPPRLSLHQSDGLDLSLWSESLISGISLSDAPGEGFGYGFGLGNDMDKEDEVEKDGEMTAKLDSKPWNPTFSSQRAAASNSRSNPSASATTTTTTSNSTVNRPRAQLRLVGQPIPQSKPPPTRPIPPILIANPNGLSHNNQPGPGRDSLPPLTGFADSAPTPRHMPSNSTNGKAARFQNETGNNLLSPPPPSAWSTNSNNYPSPSGVSPDSGRLWNEIENMMDPKLMTTIPGLNLGVALPPGAQNVLKSAGVDPPPRLGEVQLPPPPQATAKAKELKINIVNEEDKPSSSAALTEAHSATLPFTPEEERIAGARKIRTMAGEGALGTKSKDDAPNHRRMGSGGFDKDMENDENGSGSEYSDELDLDAYTEDINDVQLSTALRVPNPRGREGAAVADGRLLSVIADDSLLPLDRGPNRDSSRSSSSTITVTAVDMQMTASTTIVRNVSIARRAGAYVIGKNNQSSSLAKRGVNNVVESKHPPSPLSSHFGGSEESTGSGGSESLFSQEHEYTTPTTTDGGLASPLNYYLDGTQSLSPNLDKMSFSIDSRHLSANAPTQRIPGNKTGVNIKMNLNDNSNVDYDDDDNAEFAGYPDEVTMEVQALAAGPALPTPTNGGAPRPTIVISDEYVSTGPHTRPLLSAATISSPLSPFQRYRGWLSDVVAPLEEFIDDADPREHYQDLREIAEGESGSVFAAIVNPTTAHKLNLLPHVKARDTEDVANSRPILVAIKSVAIVPSGSPKLVDLQKELSLMRGLWHENVLGMDGVYVDLLEDSLWVRMELMERSLADIIGLVADGLQLPERTIARFASDVLCALDYLQKNNISHRDVRSDNLLLNKHGVLKLADFSNAVQVTPKSSTRSDSVGVAFWQAPEVRKPPYDALKVDVWSLGATVWEMAQQDPPFADTQQLADRWPPLRQPEIFSPAFHDFLKKCSEPASLRPSPSDLLKSPLIVHKACGRQVIVLLLSQCMAIEEKHLQQANP